MKIFSVTSAFLLSAALSAFSQGTSFVYDQQSSTNSGYYGYGGGQPFQQMLPTTGQSFTPSLSGIDFIRLSIADGNLTDGLGSTWFLNLHSDSITGPILGTTASVDLPDTFAGAANFYFPSTIPLTPGTSYFFDINSPDGGTWYIFIAAFNYPGGNAWGRNQSLDFTDYWFREGLVVPEPSSAALLILGGAALAYFRRPRR
jgi:hypothetical protein